MAKLHGLDAPTKIEQSGPDGGPIETEEKPDYSKLTLYELLQFEELHRKALWREDLKSFRIDFLAWATVSSRERNGQSRHTVQLPAGSAA